MSAPGLGPPLRCHICAGTGLAAATSAPGLGPPLRCHTCAGTGLDRAGTKKWITQGIEADW